MRPSLRLRVVAAAVATVAVVSIAAGALLVALVRHDLRATLDDRLAGQARTVASIARSREATQLALALNRPENRGLRFDEGITRVLSGDTVILEFGHVPHPFPKPRANGYADIIGIRPIHNPGVRTAVDREVIFTGSFEVPQAAAGPISFSPFITRSCRGSIGSATPMASNACPAKVCQPRSVARRTS